MVKFTISPVGTTLKLQRRCPNCGRNNGNIHCAIHRRRITDTRIDFIPQRRMKCPWCNTTWTIRPEGISDGRHRTDRLILMGVVLYMFGLSHRRGGKAVFAIAGLYRLKEQHRKGCGGSRTKGKKVSPLCSQDES
ncbi:MAG: hypothetical protein MUO27_09185 [Sedimentisphaerales bacterium]|nr:hypothetical protein [Sedimentisphaerales bacterium]